MHTPSPTSNHLGNAITLFGGFSDKAGGLQLKHITFVEQFRMDFANTNFQIQIMSAKHSIITCERKLFWQIFVITSSINWSLLIINISKTIIELFKNIFVNHFILICKKIAKKGAQSVPIGIPMLCLNSESPQTTQSHQSTTLRV